MKSIAAFADTMPMQWSALRSPRTPAAGPTRDLAKWLSAASRWLEWTRSRQSLDELDDHLLKDIGLTRSDARREADKSFWQL
jgi:uncharacterized protein YjiS (DUF1127 family)